MLKDFSRRMLDATGGAGGAGDGGAAAAAAAAAAAGAAKPWHDGIDTELIGHAQNKGWKLDDPKAAFSEAAKAARELQNHFGVPPDRLLKLPKDASDEAGWNTIYQRLGAPADAKEYDFSAVKRADGQAPDAALLDTIRATAASLRLPKDKAPDLAAAVVKHLDGVATEQAAAKAATYTTERAALEKNWGANFEFNKAIAAQGAKNLGLTETAVTAMEKEMGYASLMEAMRKIGMLRQEDGLIGGGPAGGVATVEGAKARLNDLIADKAWGQRFDDHDPAARREFDSLTRQIAAAA